MTTSLDESISGLAAYLYEDGLLDGETAQSALLNAEQQKIAFVSYLVQMEILTSSAILNYCVQRFRLPTYDIKKFQPSTLLHSVVKPDLIYQYRVIPLHQDQQKIVLAVADPTDYRAMNAIRFHTGLHIELMLIAEADLSQLINTLCRPTVLYSEFDTALKKILLIKEFEKSSEYTDEIIVKFVDQLIQDAYVKKISDIHIEPYERHCRIRFRRDGLLYTAATIPLHVSTQIITRLKVMSNLNTAEKRLPQDGRLQLNDRNKIDIRINICPTIYGEKIVLRLLTGHLINLNIHALGLSTSQKEIFFEKLALPHGLIIITGPTGCGKTLTLYAVLHYLNQIEKNIISVEDPVEIQLEGINQVNVNPKIGLDFVTALRAFLRQDPDVIMIGEIRDHETANIALQAALTGHFVLASLHTNTATEVTTRLHSIGMLNDHFANALSLVVSQRLLRKLCTHCKRFDKHTQCYQASGCEHCHLGYNGRVGIFELHYTNHKVNNHLDLWHAGLEKVATGITSQAELVRVIGKE